MNAEGTDIVDYVHRSAFSLHTVQKGMCGRIYKVFFKFKLLQGDQLRIALILGWIDIAQSLLTIRSYSCINFVNATVLKTILRKNIAEQNCKFSKTERFTNG
jgi:hypothetical protein